MVKRAIAFVAAGAAVSVLWAGPAGAVSGSQRFTIRFTGTNSGIVYASGPISGTGRDRSINENTDRFIFKNGSVTVNHQPTSHSESFDPRSCSGSVRETGNYQLAGGTKKYAGASGNGTYSLRGTVRSQRTSKGCSERGSTFTGTATASGRTNLP